MSVPLWMTFFRLQNSKAVLTHAHSKGAMECGMLVPLWMAFFRLQNSKAVLTHRTPNCGVRDVSPALDSFPPALCNPKRC